MLNKLKNIFMTAKASGTRISIGDMVLLLTKNLIITRHSQIATMVRGPLLSDVYRTWYLSLDFPPSMAAVHPWFHTSLLKPAGPQPAGPPVLEDDSYEVEAILQINKRGTYAKVKWMGYDSSHNQWIRLSEL